MKCICIFQPTSARIMKYAGFSPYDIVSAVKLLLTNVSELRTIENTSTIKTKEILVLASISSKYKPIKFQVHKRGSNVLVLLYSSNATSYLWTLMNEISATPHQLAILLLQSTHLYECDVAFEQYISYVFDSWHTVYPLHISIVYIVHTSEFFFDMYVCRCSTEIQVGGLYDNSEEYMGLQ